MTRPTGKAAEPRELKDGGAAHVERITRERTAASRIRVGIRAVVANGNLMDRTYMGEVVELYTAAGVDAVRIRKLTEPTGEMRAFAHADPSASAPRGTIVSVCRDQCRPITQAEDAFFNRHGFLPSA